MLQAQSPWSTTETIAMPDVGGRIDHLAVDLTNGRLFVAALGNDSVEVLDVRAGRWLRRLTGFKEPQGIAFAPERNIIAVANGGSGELDLVDGADFHVVKTVSLGGDADNVRYDPTTARLYVGYGAGALAAVELDGRRSGDVKLAGHPESFQLEKNGPRIFVNVPDAHYIAVVDRTSMKLLATWPVTDAAANYPMALDEENHRLFIGCRRPATVLVYDTSSGKRVGSAPIVGDTDDLFYDAARKRLYVVGGEGFVDVLHQDDPDHLARLARVPSASGARTALFVPDQGRLYLAVPQRGAQKSEIRVFGVPK
jgi:DNA-binding beta-propeller fold protein YncE